MASLVTVDELSAAATTIIADSYRSLETVAVISVLYLAISLGVTRLQTIAEQRLPVRTT